MAAPFNSKAKLWSEGRKNLNEKIRITFSELKEDIVWFHCSSLGEFEQGRPLLEKYKITHPKTKTLLTFFSPSGYEIRKNYKSADWVFYLPADTQFNSHHFLTHVKPKAAFFVKYDFWFNYLHFLAQFKIPTYFISVNLRPSHYFFKWYGTWALNHLKNVSHFYTQNNASSKLLEHSGIHQCTVAGDTRFDRVIALSKEKKEFPFLEKFCSEKHILVAGSTWPEDEKLLAKLQNLNLKLILAPHEILEENCTSIEDLFAKQNVIRFSRATVESLDKCDVLLIDSIGILGFIYRYASICYIGGGFGKGIHNVLEATVYGKPVFFGPNYLKFNEALELIQLGAATSVNSINKLQSSVQELLSNEKKYREQCLIAEKYVHGKGGAVDIILNSIQKFELTDESS